MRVRVPTAKTHTLGSVPLGVPVCYEGEFFIPCTNGNCRFYVCLLDGFVRELNSEVMVYAYPNAILLPDGEG